MANYDFRGLSHFDFEVLCHDLLEAEIGVKLQAFATGRDKGIDLRHAIASDNTLIVQCKHYAKSGFKKLIASIKRSELPKVQKLAPQRYLLATTVDLTSGNVDELYDLLQPYCVSKQDIFGASALNHLLQKYPEVEKANFKLWLTSTAVLERVLNAGVFFASEKTVEQIRDRFGMFVETTALEPARKQLHRKKVCILSGHPGVGKTTLAEILITEHLEKEWQLVVIDSNMKEAEGLFSPDPSVKQLFYYDDFLGQISDGEKLGKNEDRLLLRMIEAVRRTRNRRFLLTTREYVLAQAKKSHEVIARSEIDLFKFVVECEQYSDLDKAKIFANHLYFANVPQEHVAAVVSNGIYRTIISHENYNPRIIEVMTKTSRVSRINASKYPGEIVRALDNPADIWLHAFENKISEASRHLVLTLASCGDGIVFSDLQRAFESFFLKRSAKYHFQAMPLSFQHSLAELEDSFVRVSAYGNERVVSFQNPSVLDFVKNWLLSHTPDAWDLLDSVISFEQVERLLAVLDFVTQIASGNADDSERICAVLQRTYSSSNLKLMRRTEVFRFSGNAHFTWSAESANPWSRILACCQFMKMLSSSTFQSFVLDSLSELIAQVKASDETVWAKCFRALYLIYNIAPADWYDRHVMAIFDRLTECNFSRIHDVDFFSELSQWLEFNKELFPAESVKSIATRMHEQIVLHVESALNMHEPSHLGSFLELFRELSDRLGLDTSSDIEWLEDLIDQHREDEGPEPERMGPSSVGDESREIDNLFHALIE